MTITAVKPGGWDSEEVLTSDDMNALQAELVKAIDGAAGGSYSPSGDLQFTGVVFRWINGTLELQNTQLHVLATSTVSIEGDLDVDGDYSLDGDGEITGRLDITSTGEAHVNSGALFRVDGGGFLTAAAGSTTTLGGTVDITIDASGSIDLASGGKITGVDGAEIKLDDAEDFRINNSSYSFNVNLATNHLAAWGTSSTNNAKIMALANGTYLLVPLPLPVGDTITTLEMNINGGAGGTHGGVAPNDAPKLALVRINPISGAVTVIQEVADPVTGAAYDSNHTVSLSGGSLPYVVTSDMHYARIQSEGPDGGVANATHVFSVRGTALAASVRGIGGNELY
jgi:hypothetical protein